MKQILICLFCTIAVPLQMPVASKQQFVNQDGSKIREGSWYLVSLERNGSELTRSEIRKRHQILLVTNEYYALVMDSGQVGQIKYQLKLNPKKHDGYEGKIDFLDVDPETGSIKEYKALFKMQGGGRPGSNIPANLVICRFENPNKDRPTAFSTTMPGVIVETYRRGKL